MDPIKWKNHRQSWADIENDSDFTAFPSSTSEYAPPTDISRERQAKTTYTRRAPVRRLRAAPRRSSRQRLQRSSAGAMRGQTITRGARATASQRPDATYDLEDGEELTEESKFPEPITAATPQVNSAKRLTEVPDSRASEQSLVLQTPPVLHEPFVPPALEDDQTAQQVALNADQQNKIHHWLQSVPESLDDVRQAEALQSDERYPELESKHLALGNLPYSYVLASQTIGVPEEVLRAKDYDESSEEAELSEIAPAANKNAVVDDEDEIEEPWAQPPQPPRQYCKPSGLEKQALRTSPASSVTRVPETSIPGDSSPVRRAPGLPPPACQPLNRSLSNTANARRDLERTFREKGLYALVSRVLRAETDAYSTWNGVPTSLIEQSGYSIAATTHPKILSACIRGNWTRNKKTDKTLASVLRMLKQRALSMKHPFIYLNEVADANGHSPSPRELKQAIEVARAYYNGSDLAMAKRIDSFTKPFRTPAQDRDPNFRKYIMSSRRPAVSAKRLTTGRAFCKHLEDRLAACQSQDEPLDVALVEVGYTHDADVRLKNHQRHTSSNYIMNLFDAILNLLFPQKYLLHQYVIYSCCAAAEVALAESFFSRCADCYIGRGGGFSFYAAGISVRSAYIYDTQHWEDAVQWARKYMGVDAIDEKEMVRCRESRESVKKLLEETEGELKAIEDFVAAHPEILDDEGYQSDTLDEDEVVAGEPGTYPVSYEVLIQTQRLERVARQVPELSAKVAAQIEEAAQ
ncbi:hypothetical protein KC318_g263 [Hortaea werneckii]|nr:hypothetical protein KC334_g270 [Hortaea werneckii]KAI7027469.1 hypothetical protein KC355_g318 [Hortaea werneckii]KAI7205203.1 hypothetical protein KC324_g424 [Hortaea werneckii]KAI7362775.1 hypothetical protein KC354_g7026 [Hortaea werneckii]KAI7595665.1 hypothetical protein KC316_g384 [Hortaea werneckii]